MKKQLLGTAMGVSVLGAARASFQAPTDIGSNPYLVCRPRLDRNDRNPVVVALASVTATLAEWPLKDKNRSLR
jgi:hypothetical protein